MVLYPPTTLVIKTGANWKILRTFLSLPLTTVEVALTLSHTRRPTDSHCRAYRKQLIIGAMCKCNCNIFSVSLHYTNQQPSHSHFCSLWWSNYIRCRIVDGTGTELAKSNAYQKRCISMLWGRFFQICHKERERVKRKDGHTSSWLRCVSPP